MNSTLFAHGVVKLTSRRAIYNDFSTLILVAIDAEGNALSITFSSADGEAPVIESLEDHIVKVQHA